MSGAILVVESGVGINPYVSPVVSVGSCVTTGAVSVATGTGVVSTGTTGVEVEVDVPAPIP